jgi:hypothetical protein
MVWLGKQEVTALIHGPLVMLGDVPVPPEAVMTFEGADGTPDVTMRFRVRDGRPECADISVRAKDDGRGIRSADLAMFHVDTLAIGVFEQLAVESAMLSGSDDVDVVSVRRDITEARLRTRGVVNHAELERVAEVYREHGGHKPAETVAKMLGYSKRTAARRIKQAEEAGLLPPTTPGKRRS